MNQIWAVGSREFEQLLIRDVFREAMNNAPGGTGWWLHVGGYLVVGSPKGYGGELR